ncbi:MAG: phosphoribosylaminoimidazolecarboxamide formyltransferase [Rhodospirillales bacterium]|nr:phosphoribosylaminoimidazolecarboxamide formyltransferase [Rhodospirillales bacterium]MSP80881.1 phosphoribosylaminoimidazolecarboxamide formyltransferase [Rhodospirillales bacterium]
MGDDNNPGALRELETRLARARAGETLGADRPEPGAEPPKTALGVAMRVSVELVAAVAVGVAIGWLIDAGLDTGPWGLVVFVFLGGIAGILNVYKLAKGLSSGPGYRRNDDTDK